MDRRYFLQGSAVAAVAAAAMPTLSATTDQPVIDGKPGGTQQHLPDEGDRSPTRDPLALQRSTLVVEGLIAGEMRLPHLQAQRNGGVDCGVIGMPSDSLVYARELKFFDQHREEYVVARTVGEIRRAKQQGKICQVYGWQSAETLGAAFNEPIGTPNTPLRAYYEQGLRILGIAYNVANQFGGGCIEPHIGLTRAGRRLVEEIHQLRMVLDVGGHTGEQATIDALAISSGVPVVCTHTNVAAINDNARCVSDRVIEGIANTGGVVGLTAVSDFHARNRKNANSPHTAQIGLSAYLDQFDYVRKLVGADHVGLGPDFVDGMPIPYDAVNREVIPRDMVSDGTWLYVKGFESISELPNVTRGLIERGWSSSEIRKALGGNWLRVYEQVWGG